MSTDTTTRLNIYTLGFLRTLQGAITLFVYASLLEKVLGEGMTLGAYSIRAAIVVILLLGVSIWRVPLKKPKVFFVTSNIIMVIGVIIFMFSTTSVPIITGFTLHLLGSMFVLLTLDEFMEQISNDEETGAIRGGFLTSLNLARFFGPMIAGFILQTYAESMLFSVVLILIGVLMTIGISTLPNDPKFKKEKHPIKLNHLFDGITDLLKNKIIRSTLIINFLLQTFYIVSVLFLAIGMQEYAGATWSESGIAISAMLIPFLFLQIPLGNLADKKLGETEMMIAGSIIITLGMIFLVVVANLHWMWWAAALFVSRIGATMVETMTESYYYKHIDAEDVSAITLLRALFPLAYLTTAGGALALLTIPGVQIIHLFGISGALMLFAIPLVLKLPDTK